MFNGAILVGAEERRGGDPFFAIPPSTGDKGEVAFANAFPADVADGCALAETAFESFPTLSPDAHADVLEAGQAGRILTNGWPTGVEVTHAMVHGGTFPATSDGPTTSVGTPAMMRFLRPVCYQDLPDALLPPPLQAANPWNLTRRVEGKLEIAG